MGWGLALFLRGVRVHFGVHVRCGKENWILEVRFKDLGVRCWGLSIIGCRVLGFRCCTFHVACRMWNVGGLGLGSGG